MYACYEGAITQVKDLITVGADTQIKDTKGILICFEFFT